MSSLPYLDEAWECIQRLELPLGWTLEWCIQQDGDGLQAQRTWFDDPRVSYGYSDRWLWAAMNRNIALTRASGDYLFCLDADDLLLPDAILKLAAGFEDHPQIAWSFGRIDELVEGKLRRRDNDLIIDGVCPVGWFAQQTKLRNKTPFPSTMTLYRMEAVLSVGGWPAYTDQEDTILLMTVNRRWQGWLTNEITGHYRRHDGQTTQLKWFRDAERTAGMYQFLARLGEIGQWEPGEMPVAEPLPFDQVIKPTRRSKRRYAVSDSL